MYVSLPRSDSRVIWGTCMLGVLMPFVWSLFLSSHQSGSSVGKVTTGDLTLKCSMCGLTLSIACNLATLVLEDLPFTYPNRVPSPNLAREREVDPRSELNWQLSSISTVMCPSHPGTHEYHIPPQYAHPVLAPGRWGTYTACGRLGHP